MSSRVDLPSGIWLGHYEQMGHSYPQDLKLEFADGLIRGDGVDDLGTFSIDGEYRAEGSEMRMGWIKTYDGAHSVLYLGELLDRTIRGRWSLSGESGTFALAPADRLGATGEMS